MIERLTIKADKNCAECEAELLSANDINIEYLFEDWRECAEHCDECKKAEQVEMCNLQFEIINLLANSIAELRLRLNAIASIVLKRDEKGAKLLQDQIDNMEQEKRRSQALFS